MIINEIHLSVRELIKSYQENDDTGKVTAWNGKLDVRPEFQREFVYNEKQQSAVINTVLNNFPLNIMYFVDRQNGEYEVLDGQQRIISICRYATNNAISVKIPASTGGYNSINFANLPDELRNKFLDYELQIYICEGSDQEKFDWFQIINIAGEELEKQEIRNALYHGPWLTDAKSAFSRNNCAAKKKYGKYLKGDCIRQDYLETVFTWKAVQEGYEGKDAIEKFMQIHRTEKNANAIWDYFEAVFEWVQYVFGKNFDKSMKGVAWGLLYNEHKDDILNPEDIQKEVKELLSNEEITQKSGIYTYILTGEEKYLSPRKFDDATKSTVYEEQEHKCALCGKVKELKDMHADHKIPWSKGGRTEKSNCQMLCAECNLKKNNH